MLNIKENELKLWDIFLSKICYFIDDIFRNDILVELKKLNIPLLLEELENNVGRKAEFDIINKLNDNLINVEIVIKKLHRDKILRTKIYYINDKESVVFLSEPELLTVKGFLIITLNRTKDYIEFFSMVNALGFENSIKELLNLNNYYKDVSHNNKTTLFQLCLNLSHFALNLLNDETNVLNLLNYNAIRSKWESAENFRDFINKFNFELFKYTNL